MTTYTVTRESSRFRGRLYGLTVSRSDGAAFTVTLDNERVVRIDRVIKGRVTSYNAVHHPHLVAAVEAAVRRHLKVDLRIDGYNPEFLGAKPARAGEDY